MQMLHCRCVERETMPRACKEIRRPPFVARSQGRCMCFPTHAPGARKSFDDGGVECPLREEKPLGRKVTLHPQPERVRGLSQLSNAKSVRQGMLEGDDGRKGAGDDGLITNVH